jgi:ribosomal protein L39E
MEAHCYLIEDRQTGERFFRKYGLKRKLKTNFPAPRYQVVKTSPVSEYDTPIYPLATYRILHEKGLL